MVELSQYPVDGAVRFTVLGPVRAWRDGGELQLGPRQQRLILSLLLAHAGRPVSMRDFVDLLWDGDPPASATNAVHRYVGALRRLLEPGLPTRSPGRWLARQSGGYVLRADEDSLDLLGFRAMVDRARHAEAAGKPGESLNFFAAALDLRQGRCAGDLEQVSGHPRFVMLEREYASVVCEAADTALRHGRAEEMLLPLRLAAERDPLDEKLLARLLLVLASDGKQAEALASFEEIRLRLAEELGVHPGAELRRAHERILQHRFDGRRGQEGHGSPSFGRRPAQLPPDVSGFTGRHDALAQATYWAARGGEALRVTAVDGVPGVGKTTFAIHFAHQVAPGFPDGQLYADLRGFAADGEPVKAADVLEHFLGALGVAPGDIPPASDRRSALYRRILAERRVLVVLDNARDHAQVKPLLPETGTCLVVITSRPRLASLAASHGARLLSLDVLSPAEATSLFLERVRDSRAVADADEIQPLVERCDGLPLAVATIAARAAAYPERPFREIGLESPPSAALLSAPSHSRSRRPRSHPVTARLPRTCRSRST